MCRAVPRTVILDHLIFGDKIQDRMDTNSSLTGSRHYKYEFKIIVIFNLSDDISLVKNIFMSKNVQ